MNIVVAVRCYNEANNIERFMRGYDFADSVVVSDGGSTDGSVEMLQKYPKVILHHYENYEVVNGERWNSDAMHINFVLNKAKELKPTFLIFDDMDDVPTKSLRENARSIFETCTNTQVYAFRLYMWGDHMHFPFTNRNFNGEGSEGRDYRSLWAWSPSLVDIKADEAIRHGTIIGMTLDRLNLEVPNCLLHYSWHPNTIRAKMDRYNRLGLPMNHPFEWAGSPTEVPDWAKE